MMKLIRRLSLLILGSVKNLIREEGRKKCWLRLELYIIKHLRCLIVEAMINQLICGP